VRATAGVPVGHGFRRTRANVVVEYSGGDSVTRARIRRAVAGLG